MPITVVFDPPLPSDSPSTFNTKAFTLLGDLNDWSTEANALPGEVATNLTTLLASPPAIGSTTPAAVNATTLNTASASVGTTNVGLNRFEAASSSFAGDVVQIYGYSNSDTYNALRIVDNGGNVKLNVRGDGAVTIPGSVTAGAVTVASTATGGFSVVDLTTNGNDWEIGAGGSSSSKANSFYIQDITNSAFRFAIDSAGEVTIPGSLSAGATTINSTLNIAATNSNTSIYRFESGSNGVNFSLLKSKSDTVNQNVIVASGDTLGTIYFGGANGTGYSTAAQIRVSCAGTPGASGDMPGSIDLMVSADGSATPASALYIAPNKAVTIPGTLSLTGGTFGYGTGAGGTVTQATSKSTSVTLNKPSGQITMHNAALAAGASVAFIVNNTTVSAIDTVVASVGNASVPYYVDVTYTAANRFDLTLTSRHTVSASEAVTINFAVISGASS